MHFTSTIAAAILGMTSLASAHMALIEPAPLRSSHNPHNGGNIDYDMTSPLDASGSNFPCKGSLNLLGTAAGASVVDYTAGQEYKMTIDGGAFHSGGSCQASLSFDQGKTWKVIHSYVGNCPASNGKTSYPFVIPADTPSGEAVFAWSWFNKVGNREMYMNCAVVTIKGGASKKKRGASDPMSSRPAMFVANVGNGCSTIEGKDLMFPDLGPDVTMDSDNTAPPPEAQCAKSSNGGNNGGGSKPDPKPEPKPSSSVVNNKPTSTATLPGGVFITVSPTVEPEVPATTSVPANIPSETAAPEPEPTVPVTTVGPSKPVPTGGAGTVYPAGTACAQNGFWNCVDGKQFQRCGSGFWTPLQPVAPGTKCVPGVMQDIVISKRRFARAL